PKIARRPAPSLRARPPPHATRGAPARRVLRGAASGGAPRERPTVAGKEHPPRSKQSSPRASKPRSTRARRQPRVPYRALTYAFSRAPRARIAAAHGLATSQSAVARPTCERIPRPSDRAEPRTSFVSIRCPLSDRYWTWTWACDVDLVVDHVHVAKARYGDRVEPRMPQLWFASPRA